MSEPLRVGELCAGYSGLGLGLAQVLDVQLAWYSEIDPGASAVLAHRFPGVPNHGDLTAMDWSQVEPVDVMTAGWPCQPWSQAGKRKGAEDERAIWPYVAAAIRAVRPRYVLLENVSSIAGAGELARACGDLAAVGYVGSWRCVRASDVGAPHRRERIFVFAADTAGAGWGFGEPVHVGEDSAPAAQRAGETEPGRRDRVVADSAGVGWGEGRPEPARLQRGSDAAVAGDAVTHPDGAGSQGTVGAEAPNFDGWLDEPGAVSEQHVAERGDWAGYAPAIHRWETSLGRRAPDPTVLGRRGGRQLNPVFVEWLMGLPAGWVCDVPGLTRNQKLKVLGNGVVPAQAAAAFRALWPLLADVEVAA